LRNPGQARRRNDCPFCLFNCPCQIWELRLGKHVLLTLSFWCRRDLYSLEQRIPDGFLRFCKMSALEHVWNITNLLRECEVEADRFSAVSANDFPASSRFGFLSADMASLSSASILACFFAFEITSGASLLKSTSRRANRFDLSTPALFASKD
jgi:hypothetical protein